MLLDLPFFSHLKPIASTSSVIAAPHVATVPVATSLPGALRVCTLFPGGVIGPVSASAFASIFPRILKHGRLAHHLGTLIFYNRIKGIFACMIKIQIWSRDVHCL
jgi:hypothetical protein